METPRRVVQPSRVGLRGGRARLFWVGDVPRARRIPADIVGYADTIVVADAQKVNSWGQENRWIIASRNRSALSSTSNSSDSRYSIER
jgi:hypothetical protein